MTSAIGSVFGLATCPTGGAARQHETDLAGQLADSFWELFGNSCRVGDPRSKPVTGFEPATY